MTAMAWLRPAAGSSQKVAKSFYRAWGCFESSTARCSDLINFGSSRLSAESGSLLPVELQGYSCFEVGGDLVGAGR